MMTSDHTYLGWTNQETWSVNLHLTNDRALYETMGELRSMSRPGDPRGRDFAELVQEYVTDGLVDEYLVGAAGDEPRLLIWDLVRDALARVNWQEIADSWDD